MLKNLLKNLLNNVTKEMLQAEVTLETSHIGKGCDRDTYNLASQRQLCGASDLAIDLLPDPQHVRKHTVMY